ncbi:DUF3683 domain-containing protein [Desulfospira joergensenii]|uniref:DUF3683 domain-containing protein n=1 Tax=Desulfospira joergensenii TaxID=53329 RepID=UPI0003B74231|nr:DUF3683 domain-containing protein [Desulfospira joergensenii]
MSDPKRKIPYNYTSADDDQIIRHLFGSGILREIRSLDRSTDTGRSSRLLHRFMGDLFIIQRNPFLFQELAEHPVQRRRLFSEFENDLSIIRDHARHPGVLVVLDACGRALSDLSRQIQTVFSHQQQILRRLGPVIGKENIYFDPFNITAHITDATDWRRFAPLAVLRPDQEDQVPLLVKGIKDLGFEIIPRGAGTGLTGGATPLTPTCVMINTEKLNKIFPITHEKNGQGKTFASMEVQAGVVTQDAKDEAKNQGLIFATDPTSAWACTIGGNLAENAGGKTAVLFGTAIDNVLSYKITMPDGISYTVRRQDHLLRKILAGDHLVFHVYDDRDRIVETIELSGDEIRKKGLGKDVTNKTLNGLPGIQKEGCDGIITSAKFVLYPEFQYKKTFCIEFFGNDMAEAGKVIMAISKEFSDQDPALMALEHLDEEYIKAIKYKTKQPAGSRLKAVLLIDMVADDPQSLARGIERLEDILEPYDRTSLSIAGDEKEARRFWDDRKRLGAIAAHTNAFKLNEDIVLPMDSLADFVRFIDQTNLEEKKYNQIRIIQAIVDYLTTAKPLADPEWLTRKVSQARNLAYEFKKKLDIASRDALEAEIHSKNFYGQVVESLRGYSRLLENIDRIYRQTRARLIVIATHMHAGDGNVHVNIPVFSNDREMMERASMTADRVMEKSVELQGAVSGEHGIGLTKFKHLSPDIIEAFEAYRKKIDPHRIMNPNKLSEPDIIDKVFTPSFNLLELEARILKHGSLSELAMKIANCVRCGKCKPLCPVFNPGGNMFFHPRNKNLGIGALIEAMLYIAQRTHSTGFKVMKNLEEIADHCTICHRCLIKCPVNIDSGHISIEERKILKAMDFKHTPLSTRMTLSYLGSKKESVNRLMRPSLLNVGSALQRTGSRLFSPLTGLQSVKQTRTAQILRTPVSMPPLQTLRAFLPNSQKNQALLLEPEQTAVSTVFYFPGCGSERVFSRISMAGLFILLKAGCRVILPPPYLCCGYPLRVNARKEEADRISLENIIIMTQIRDMFHDLEFDACVVSCGTCMESLSDLGIESVFDCHVEDVSGFALKGLEGIGSDQRYLYHAPCHDSLKEEGAFLLGQTGMDVVEVPYCCSEAGTLALSRPDISHSMLIRKGKAIQETGALRGMKILTNCPSCVQGLGRHTHLKLKPVHLAEELALLMGGKNWVEEFREMVRSGEQVNF